MIFSARRPRIVISGLTAAGKTTHAKALANTLNAPYFSASELLRKVATVRSRESESWGERWSPRVDEVRSADADVDAQVDREMLRLLNESDRGIFDAALLPWLHSDPSVINVWIQSDEASRVRKCYVSHIDNAQLSLNDARDVVRKKDVFSASVLMERQGSRLAADQRFQMVASNTDLIPEATVSSAAVGAATFGSVLLTGVRYLLGAELERPDNPRIVRLEAGMK